MEETATTYIDPNWMHTNSPPEKAVIKCTHKVWRRLTWFLSGSVQIEWDDEQLTCTLCTWCKPHTPGMYLYTYTHNPPCTTTLQPTKGRAKHHPHTLVWVECHCRWDHPLWIKGLRSWEGRPSRWRGNWVRRGGTISAWVHQLGRTFQKWLQAITASHKHTNLNNIRQSD